MNRQSGRMLSEAQIEQRRSAGRSSGEARAAAREEQLAAFAERLDLVDRRRRGSTAYWRCVITSIESSPADRIRMTLEVVEDAEEDVFIDDSGREYQAQLWLTAFAMD